MVLHRKPPTIALVVPAFASGRGVHSVAMFLHRVLCESCCYTPDIISLAVSARDEASVRLFSPASWLRGIQVAKGRWQEISYRHIGAFLTEFEFQRYKPRRQLTELLNQYDLVQVLAGTPTWALVTANCRQPVLLQVATLIDVERSSSLKIQKGFLRLWRLWMTHINSKLECRSLENVDTVFVENVWLYRYLSRHFNSSKVVFAPPGIDVEHFYCGPYQVNGYILSVGRFSDPRKNVRLLFDAYHRVRQRMSSAPRLVLAGHPPAACDWEYAASLGIAEQVDIQGRVTLQQLADLYRGASVFVLSSNEEGLGIVILEAMASGLPVVSTDCGGPRTAVHEGKTGYLTPVGDATAMATALQRLLEDPPLRRQMGQAARQVAEERFSIAAAGSVYLEQYDRLLNQT